MDKKNSILYSFGNFSAGLTDAVFSTFVIFFYVDHLKMPPYLIGIGMTIYGIWNAINDPIFGQISDRTRSKWGRRKPYIIFGSLPLSLAFISIWVPPTGIIGENVTMMFIYFMITIFLYDTLYSLVILNWTALFPEMYKTQEERTKVSAYRQVIGVIATILGSTLPPILSESIGWGPMAVIFAILSFAALKLSLKSSFESPEYNTGQGLSLLNALKATFKSKSFITYIIGTTLVQFTFVMMQAGIPFYAKYVLKAKGIQVSLILGIIFFVSLLFISMWAKLANKYSTRKTMIISTAFFGVSLLQFWFVKSFLIEMIAAGIVGIGLAGIIVLMDVMLSDVIDEDELKTGFRREGMYFGINALLIRIGISVQSILMGYILKTSGYDAKLSVENQPQSAIIGLRSIVSIIPFIALIFAIISFKFYPLHGEKLTDIKNKVEKLHSQGSTFSS